MQFRTRAPVTFRFGNFELDSNGTELRDKGVCVRLQPQSLQVLAALISEGGRVVCREELKQRLWKDETFVGFEDGLNHAVSKLREVLGDSVHDPRFIETIPRIGYRFVAPFETVEAGLTCHPRTAAPFAKPRQSSHRRIFLLVIFVVLAFVSGILIPRRLIRSRPRPLTSIAVLPLSSLTSDVDSKSFAETVTDGLVAQLSRAGPLYVIPLTEVRKYQGSGKSLHQIGRELKVGGVIEGSLQFHERRVRVALKLVRTGTEEYIWAELYEGDVKDVAELNDQLVRDIVKEVETVH